MPSKRKLPSLRFVVLSHTTIVKSSYTPFIRTHTQTNIWQIFFNPFANLSNILVDFFLESKQLERPWKNGHKRLDKRVGPIFGDSRAWIDHFIKKNWSILWGVWPTIRRGVSSIFLENVNSQVCQSIVSSKLIHSLNLYLSYFSPKHTKKSIPYWLTDWTRVSMRFRWNDAIKIECIDRWIPQHQSMAPMSKALQIRLRQQRPVRHEIYAISCEEEAT